MLTGIIFCLESTILYEKVLTCKVLGVEVGGRVGIVGAAPNSRGFAGADRTEPLASDRGVFSTPSVADTGVDPGEATLNGIRCRYPYPIPHPRLTQYFF